MRWSEQVVGADDGALPGLGRSGLVRSVQTPEFEGVTFHEVLAKSALNQVPEASGLPFRFTVNTFRGCTHACRYCFARPTHEYLDLDAGRDFDSQVVVKLNVAAVLRKELRRRSWAREAVALGTNTDPYQRAEGRYRLMPGVISALTEAATPFSILTKGTLLRRDLPLLRQAAGQVSVHLSVSLALYDDELRKEIEPGTPSPRARLALISDIAEAGFAPHVMLAPVIPYLSDSTAHLDDLLGALAQAGAAGDGVPDASARIDQAVVPVVARRAASGTTAPLPDPVRPGCLRDAGVLGVAAGSNAAVGAQARTRRPRRRAPWGPGAGCVGGAPRRPAGTHAVLSALSEIHRRCAR